MMKNQKEKIAVVVLAAGEGRRFSRSLPKQFLVIERKPVFIHSLLGILRGLKHVPETIIICAPSQYRELARRNIEKHLPLKWQGRTVIVSGGKTRIASYDEAVKHLIQTKITYNVVITQDAARPCTQPTVIPRLLRQFRQTPENAVCITGAALTESLFLKSKAGVGVRGVNREQYILGRTPYAFSLPALQSALRRWRKQGGENGVSATADILQFLPLDRGQKIGFLETDEPNPKLTFPEDTNIIRQCLKKSR